MDPVATAVLTSWSFDWEILALLSAVAAIYLRGWLRLRPELPHKYTPEKLAAFIGGLAAVALALESPLDALGEFLLQAHMIQHLLLMSVAPPLLLLGQPVLPLLRGLPRWLFKDALGPFLAAPELKQAGRAIVHPAVTWLALSAAVIVWHSPRFYELALRSPGWHQVEHAIFFWTAVLFWWPVVGVWPGHSIWPRWTMIPYLLLENMVSMGLSAILSFSDHVLYSTYALAPRLWDISALEDQRAAGGIMWVPGSIAMLVPAAILGMQLLEPRRARPQTPVFRILTPRRPHQWNLLQRLLRYRHFRRSVQTVMLVLAAAVAFDGFFGTPVAPMNLAGVLPWTYWRGFAVIGLLLAGNLFCMACPFTLPRDLARKFVIPRLRWPAALRSKWIAVGLLATYLWAYEAFALWNSPRATAWIVVGYFAAAFAVDTTFKGASFCKYVCPIGQFHFVNSLVSPLEVKVREAAVCGTCATHDCIRGNAQHRGCELQLFQPAKTGNFDCTFCLDCVQACPHDNVGILPANRQAPAPARLSRRWDVAALVLILVFGAFLNAAGMTGPAMMWMHQLHARLGSMLSAVTAIYVAGLLIAPALLVAACAWISRIGSGAPWKDLIGSFAMALVPIGFSMWLGHFSNHLFAGWSGVPSLELCFLDLGLLLTLYTAWRAARRLAASMLPWAALACALYCFGVWIVAQPMQMRGMN